MFWEVEAPEVRHSAQEGGKVVRPYARAAFTPPSPPARDNRGIHICCRLSRPQGHIAAGRLANEESQGPHWESNPRPSDL